MNFATKLLSAIAISLSLCNTAHAETIPPNEAAHYIGHTVTVEGVVTQVSTSGSGTTFINFGGRYPNISFYAVIFRRDAALFSGVGAWEGHTVAITGSVELYKGKPEIILSSPSQLELRD